MVRPDLERLHPFQEFPPSTNVRSQRRVLGLFAYYAKLISNFSKNIQPLLNATPFPLSSEAINAFNLLKSDNKLAAFHFIDEGIPFVVECDATEIKLSATQGGLQVAFMSRTLQGSELHYPPVEKGETAIIERYENGSIY